MNKTHSYPLHFAARRSKPNKEILKILLRRYPYAARHVNDFGLLPLHIISTSDDVMEATRMIYEAYNDAIQICDRQGRTCLHIAVLAVGKDHTSILAAEEEEFQMQKDRERRQQQHEAEQTLQNDSKAHANDCYDSDVDGVAGEERSKLASAASSALMERQQGKSRAVVRFLIDTWPPAMIATNNFLATPVETVLEKTKPVRNKRKVVSVFGLFDDPPTARLLLLSQSRIASTSIAISRWKIPPLCERHRQICRELNWTVRKDGLLVSLAAERFQKMLSLTSNSITNGGMKGNKQIGIGVGSSSSSSSSSNNNKGQGDGSMNHHWNNVMGITKNNLLARLRELGL
eukprot:CAMPEP_0170096152 /NCGR_PEP_ID=MMETSP0019_2-20121128/28397_1 /TAXON_ID=98059 /ORGANISM="Dinobryon sp., Strain UTEXLB2267" /LENGTH=344 /DNA_ID=CAMNT_0010318051 /DNA_START=244 /DNA_END=1276 /DNA_ORIENTATION=+